jgi:hypothetical protein
MIGRFVNLILYLAEQMGLTPSQSAIDAVSLLPTWTEHDWLFQQCSFFDKVVFSQQAVAHEAYRQRIGKLLGWMQVNVNVNMHGSHSIDI